MSGTGFPFSSSSSSFSFSSTSSSSTPFFLLSSNPSSSLSSSPSLFGLPSSSSPYAPSSLFSNPDPNFGARSLSAPSFSSSLFGFGSSPSSASASSASSIPSLSFGFGASSSASASSSTPLFPCLIAYSSSSSTSGSTSPFSTSLTPGFSSPRDSSWSTPSLTPAFSFPSGSSSSPSDSSWSSPSLTPAFSFPSGSSSSLSLSSTPSSSGFQSSFGSRNAATTIAFSGTTSSSQISQESTTTAPLSGTPNCDVGSCLGCSAVFLKVGISDEEEGVSCEDEQVRNRVIKQSGVGHEEVSENSSADSEVVPGDEIDARGVACQTPLKSSLFTEANELTLYPQIVEQILDKYGDITVGSILKSTATKSTFLQLVADVVHRLCNHTLDTIDCNELQLIQTRTADAVAVGFCVDWLQERVEKVISASESQVRLMELDELDRQIDAAKKSLMEMELRRTVLKEGVDSIKAEMEGNDLGGSNLGEGLL